MSSSYRFSDGSPTNSPRGDTVYVEEPTELADARLTNNPAHSTVRPDEGYLMKGWRRVLRDEGDGLKWYYTQSEQDDEKAAYQLDPPGRDTPFNPPDIYADTKTFPDNETTVQIVEFRSQTRVPAKWYPPLTKTEKVFDALSSLPEHKDAWRWVHCEGLHGPTLKAVARSTGWPLRKFGGIFTWTRASMEWADDVILVHFQNQGTRIFMWHGGGSYRVLITCSTVNPQGSSVTRIFDFVDRGCSRPEIVLREDPSLLFYGVVRAVIQDLRYSVHHVSHKMDDAFKKSTAQPSQANLSFFYHLQDRLFILSLDTTSLKSAALNLAAAANKMHERDEKLIKETGKGDPKRLISERTRFMLNDQMGLITLLSQELPDVSRRAEAIVNLAFNTLTFNTNNWLQLLAVATLASLPLNVTTEILGMNYFDDNHITPKTIALVLSVVGGIVIIGLVWWSAWFIRHRRGAGDDGSRLAKEAQKGQTDSIPAMKQTDAQRQAWARAQDLYRDNQIVVERRQLHNPMMREFPEHLAPSPRPTTATTVPAPPPPKRKTAQTFSRRRTRYRSTITGRGPAEPPAEKDNSMDNAALSYRGTTDPMPPGEQAPEGEAFESIRYRRSLSPSPVSDDVIIEGQEKSFTAHKDQSES